MNWTTDEYGVKWISDENGNKCSVRYFGSEEAAEAALKSLEECKDCTNCSDCSDCSDCSGCSAIKVIDAALASIGEGEQSRV